MSGKPVIHWKLMRITSLALIPLGLWLMASLIHLAHADQAGVQAWLKEGVHATLLGLFLIVGLHHSANGVQEVIEDYVSAPGMKNIALAVEKILHFLVGLAGIVALAHMAFGV